MESNAFIQLYKRRDKRTSECSSGPAHTHSVQGMSNARRGASLASPRHMRAPSHPPNTQKCVELSNIDRDE